MDALDAIRERLAVVPDPVALLEGIFAHAPVGFQVYSADGHCLLVNPAFRDLFGSEPPPGYNVLVDEIAAERGILDLVRRSFAGETITTPPIWYDPRELRQVEVTEGRRVGIEATFFPLHGRTGEVTHVAIVFKDVSAELERREHAEAEARMLRASEQRAREANELARQAERRKDEFLAMLGHELRNPLAPIVTSLEIMRMRGELTALPERAVIERQVRHLSRLVNDLLDVSRIARGSIDLRKERVELAPVVADAVEMVAPLLEQRRHHLDIDVARDDLQVEADPARLGQVVANLLSNAAKYTDPGGAIVVRAYREDDQVVLAVRDNGPGIPPGVLPHIFDLFVQGPRALDRSQGGLGLGLALVKNLVELHGGTVTVDSGAGGSEFRVQLPAHARLPADTSDDRAVVVAPAAGPAHCRVLVVDDNCDVADTIAAALRALGFDVGIAYDGPSALGVADQLRPEVALLDIGLPLMDGYELARQLRDRGHTPRIIAVTGYGEESDRARSEAMGFAEHLVKPVELARLLAAVSS